MPEHTTMTTTCAISGGGPAGIMLGLLLARAGVEVTVLEKDGAVRGLRYRDPTGEHELRAVLTVAADGRRSDLRRAAGMEPVELGAPMDVLWLRVSRHAGEPSGLVGFIGTGEMAAMID